MVLNVLMGIHQDDNLISVVFDVDQISNLIVNRLNHRSMIVGQIADLINGKHKNLKIPCGQIGDRIIN